ncbi:MAG: hypothetical protein WCW13_01140 [archaeon]|jgi:hypothetical protein
MPLTNIPGTNIFFGDFMTPFKESRLREHNIADVFFLPPHHKLPQFEGINYHTYQTDNHPLINNLASANLIKSANSLKTNYAIFCYAGMDTSPAFALACLLARGYSLKNAKAKMAMALGKTGSKAHLKLIMNYGKDIYLSYRTFQRTKLQKKLVKPKVIIKPIRRRRK